MTILVAYSSRYGSTSEVADAVAATLREGQLGVEVLPMGEVASLDGYAAVVLGMPLYLARWTEETTQFLTRHRDALVRRPVAVFTLGPTRDDAKEWETVRGQFEDELDGYPWLSPVATALFGGKFDPAALDLPHRLLTVMPGNPLHQQPASDIRDWTAIRTWARELAALLRERLS